MGNVITESEKYLLNKETELTDPLTPGKLKKTSGPDLIGICFKTFINFLEWLGHFPPTAFIAEKSNFSSLTVML